MEGSEQRRLKLSHVVMAARKEEIEYLKSMHVYDYAPLAECIEKTKKAPIGTRWIGFWYTCGNRTSLDANPPAFRPGACNEIGFHGTGSVKSIGTAASNGCVRMFDRDAVALYDLVKEGTRVRVID